MDFDIIAGLLPPGEVWVVNTDMVRIIRYPNGTERLLVADGAVIRIVGVCPQDPQSAVEK